MARTDIHRDAMLRHLGAAYYESLHGRATRADVTRAVGAVQEQLGERAQPAAPGRPAGARHPERPDPAGRPGDGTWPRGGWDRRVRDVMTSSVVTVDRITPYKEIARLLAEHRISGLPVLKMGRQVAGVVTEADLIAAQAGIARRLRSAGRRAWWPRGRRHPALTAGELMSAPARTVGPDVTIPAAARVMSTHHVRMLPVVDEDGALAGIVSRRDLLRVFLRPDEEIAADVRRVLSEILPADPADTDVSVRNGIVTLAGTSRPEPGHDLIPLAIRLMWDVDGVVDIDDRLDRAPSPVHATQAGRDQGQGSE